MFGLWFLLQNRFPVFSSCAPSLAVLRMLKIGVSCGLFHFWLLCTAGLELAAPGLHYLGDRYLLDAVFPSPSIFLSSLFHCTTIFKDVKLFTSVRSCYSFQLKLNDFCFLLPCIEVLLSFLTVTGAVFFLISLC